MAQSSSPIYGPWPGEQPAPALGPFAKVAVISDVHGNIPALEAVLAEIDASGAELIVHCGDLTWGPEPERTVKMVSDLPAVFVRGNADRMVVLLARHGREPEPTRPRDLWMPGQHSEAAVDFLAAMPFTLVVEITGLGAVRFCHGSPRSDNECVTPQTPAERFAAFAEGLPERVFVSGHTHVQFDRRVGDWRSVNPGSVGLPFHTGEPGTAFWALLGPDVELRQTRYDLTEAIARARSVGDPSEEAQVKLMTEPLNPADTIANGEAKVFND